MPSLLAFVSMPLIAVLRLASYAPRREFSREARREIETNGSIDRMCQGFGVAILFVVIGRSKGTRMATGLAE